VVTPNIDALAASGVILDRFYAYRFCSPSRSSFLTGRNPIHVNTGNDALTLYNAKDQVSGFAGIPRNMTAIAEKLSSVGYNTVQAGKWCVFYHPTHLHRQSHALPKPHLPTQAPRPGHARPHAQGQGL
jgi:arylsulfatase A-like enzyme